MAFITPTNNVKLLTGVPINNDYENTLYFANRTAQYNYFSSKVKMINGQPVAWTDISYQRYMRNSIKLEINAEAVYDCNYMMFQNTNFGDRWFYAFIVNIEYIANQVTRIDYQIDAIQTWLLDCTIKPSFVKRMHVATDSIGVSRVPENLDTGEYQISTIEHQSRYYDTVYVMCVTSLPTGVTNLDIHNHVEYFKRVKGYGTGLYYLCFPVTDSGIQGVNTVIRKYVGGILNGVTGEDIIMIFEAPKIMFLPSDATTENVAQIMGGTDNYGVMYLPWGNITGDYNTDVDEHSIVIPTTNVGTKWYNGTYEVKNKKLCQYPYNFIYMFDGKGNSATYNYEDFDEHEENNVIVQECKFKFLTTGNADPAIMVIPQYYKGAQNNRNETFVFKGYPQCCWTNDLFKAWYAQNGGVVGSAVRMINGGTGDDIGVNLTNWKSNSNEVISGRIHIASSKSDQANGNKKIEAKNENDGVSKTDSSLSNVGSGIAGELMNLAKHSKMPSHVVGNFNTDIAYYDNVHAPMWTNMHLREDYAKRIDNYFDMYGYAINDVKLVDYWNRPHWNYIQTVGLNIIASIPESFTKEIISIFENGIRFWKNPNEVGDYTNLDNRP